MEAEKKWPTLKECIKRVPLPRKAGLIYKKNTLHQKSVPEHVEVDEIMS